MSIVRIGLAETKNFAEGYDAIFGKRKKEQEPRGEEKAPRKAAKAKKKSRNKKK